MLTSIVRFWVIGWWKVLKNMVEGEQYFQQNNDPKHTSKKATKLFQDNNIQLPSWPAQSPGLNHIEHQ